MSSSVGLHTELAAVMESLVHAAVAELKKLVEDSPEDQTGGDEVEPHLRAKLQPDSLEKMVRRETVGPGSSTTMY